MEASEKEKQEIIRTRQPFNFGIKELKRVLDRMDMPKAEKNRTIRMYKERLYTRVDEVRAKMEEKLKLPETVAEGNGTKTTGEENATDK